MEQAVREQCSALGITDERVIAQQLEAAIEAGYDDAIAQARASEEFQNAVDEAYAEAHRAVIDAVDEAWDEITEEYDLNSAFEAGPVTICESFYRNEAEDHDNDGTQDATLRLFRSDSPVNRASFLSGRAPENRNEIAIDRMHADN
jgi:putative ABC transport system permease protein